MHVRRERQRQREREQRAYEKEGMARVGIEKVWWADHVYHKEDKQWGVASTDSEMCNGYLRP